MSICGACLALVCGMAIVTPRVHRDEVPDAAPARTARDGAPGWSEPRPTRVIVELPAPPAEAPREAPERPRDGAETIDTEGTTSDEG